MLKSYNQCHGALSLMHIQMYNNTHTMHTDTEAEQKRMLSFDFTRVLTLEN